MWTALVSFIKFVWGLIFPPKGDPTTDQLVASNIEAQDQLKEEQSANVVDQKANSSVIAGDASVVRILTAAEPAPVNSAANAAIAKQFPGAVDPD